MNNQDQKNRRIRKIEEKIKELRQIIAWTTNEIHRRKIKRKATTKEKEILQKLKDLSDQQLLRREELIYLKEKTLDELRYQHTKLKHVKTRDARIRNNRMFQEDQGMSYRKTQERSKRKAKYLKSKSSKSSRPGSRKIIPKLLTGNG